VGAVAGDRFCLIGRDAIDRNHTCKKEVETVNLGLPRAGVSNTAKAASSRRTPRKRICQGGHLGGDMEPPESINSFSGCKNGLDRISVCVYFAIILSIKLLVVAQSH
jgi:hypothetical protein